MMSKAEELKKKKVKISVVLNSFEVVILCQSFNEVEREKSDCQWVGG